MATETTILTRQNLEECVTKNMYSIRLMKGKHYSVELYKDKEMTLDIYWSPKYQAYKLVAYKNKGQALEKHALIGGEYIMFGFETLCNVLSPAEDALDEIVKGWNEFIAKTERKE